MFRARPPETPLVRFVTRCSPPRWGKVLADASPRVGALFPLLNAHNVVAHTRPAHRAAAKHGALDCRDRPARVHAVSMYPKGTWPAGARASNGPTAISNNGGPPHAGASANRPADQYGSAPRGRPVPAHSRRPATAGNPAGAGSDKGPGTAAIPADQHGSPQQADQRFH